MASSFDLGDARGSVFVEYVVVLTLVSLGCALAIVHVGPGLLAYFLAQTAWLAAPVP